jgi:hypothetical protein
MSSINVFHCCATCQFYFVNKNGRHITYYCSRLKYETKPKYQFNCWQPKAHIIKLMKKRKNSEEN